MDARPETDDQAARLAEQAAMLAEIGASDDPAEAAADAVAGMLLRDIPHSTVRYRAISLVEARLSQLRALTLKQAELEHNGIGAAAAALGITRQTASEIYRRHEVPGPRIAVSLETPARRLGALAAWAERVDDTLYQRYYPLIVGGSHAAGVAMAAEVIATVSKQRRRGVTGVTGREREEAREAITTLATALAELSAGHLTTQQRSEVIYGYHHQRKALLS